MKEISEVLKTRQLLVYDDFDRLRISLFAGVGAEPKIVLHRKDESPAVQISYFEDDNDSGRIIMFRGEGGWRLAISSTSNATGVTIWDNSGKNLGSWALPEGE